MKKIILIEDDLSILNKKLHELHSKFPYPVEAIKNYDALKDFLSTDKKDVFLALLDYFIEGSPNGEALDCLIKYQIPTIVYTAEFSNDIRERVFEKGALEYLVKKESNDFLYTSRLIERVYKNDFIKTLIVDGSQSFRDSLEKNLTHFGLKSLHAHDAKSTLDQLKQHADIQLVIIDLDIKGNIQGLELVEDIREKYPATKLAILGISPHGYNSLISIEFLKKGANDFIIKPFVKEQLNLRIMQVLELLDTIEEKNLESIIDPLTGLKNRRALEREVPKIIKSVHQNEQKLSVAMIDIDHFKKVNDTYGHDIGDGVLQFLSQILSESFRKNDLLVRNGGEEFCVLIEGLSKNDSERLFEKLREKVENSPFVTSKLNIDITISIGVYYGLTDDLDTMLNIADQNLYKAKHSGRNKVIVN